MKTFLLLISFLIALVLKSLTVSAQAAGTLNGVVLDDKGLPVAYGTVTLHQQANAALVTGEAIDLEGNFKIKTPAAGTYFLRICVMGFSNQDLPAFEATGPGFSRDFGKISLKQDSKVLSEVKVEGLRPTIEVQADKMVVSVEGTAMASGSTALEVLSKAPGVWVDQDGNIQLNGKSGVRMMIDGKLTYLSGKELQTMLQSMPAENIKNLEIISNPSSKYDAEGNSGIINLNLKRNTQGGMNGSVYAGYQFNGHHGYNTGGNVNYKNKQWSSFANLDVSRRVNLRKNTMTRVFKKEEGTTYFDQSGKEVGVRVIPSLRLGTDYDFNEKHSVGAMANYTTLTWYNSFDTDTYLRNGVAAEDEFIRARNRIDGDYYNITLNGHYGFKIDTLGSSFLADVDYVQIFDQDNARFGNTFDYPHADKPQQVQNLGSDNPTKYHIYSAKADYTKMFLNKSKLEAGVKTSYVTSDNQLKFFLLEGITRVNDPNRSNHFIYKENIYAGYVNYTINLGSKWSVQGGLRAEHTVSEGYSKTLDQTTPREYLNFFPSVFVQQKVTDNYQLSYNYSRRINRPNYGSLNPFIFYLDPLIWAQGNPYLKPEYSNSFEVTQTFKNTYILTLGYSKTTDFITEIPEQNTENNTSVFGTRNVDDFDTYFGTLVAPIKISNKWDISNNVTAGYQAYSIFLKDKVQENNQFFYIFNSNHTLQLPKKIKMEFNAGYQGPLAHGLYIIEQNWWVDAAVKRSFLSDQLEASLAVTDIFRTRTVIGAANFDGNVNAFDQYFGRQSVRLNLRYRFNKGEKFENKKQNRSLEEVNRAGGNQANAAALNLFS